MVEYRLQPITDANIGTTLEKSTVSELSGFSVRSVALARIFFSLAI